LGFEFLGIPFMQQRVTSSLFNRLFLRFSRVAWHRIPMRLRSTWPFLRYGRFIQRAARAGSQRDANPRTFFLRNRPELDLISKIAGECHATGRVKIAVLACSMGAEPYSILWAIRKRHPGLDIEMTGIDILPEVISIARDGLWDPNTDHLDPLTPSEILELFDREGTMLRVKEWLRAGVSFEVGDATGHSFIERLGAQDIVVANRFLTHMYPADAEAALTRLSALVAPGGHLVCTGVDVEVRTKVIMSLGWTPVTERLEELHDGDPTIRVNWPWDYWTLEPIDKSLADWRLRYATVFRRPA